MVKTGDITIALMRPFSIAHSGEIMRTRKCVDLDMFDLVQMGWHVVENRSMATKSTSLILFVQQPLVATQAAIDHSLVLPLIEFTW